MHKAKANFSPETTHVPVNLKPKSPGLRGGGGGGSKVGGQLVLLHSQICIKAHMLSLDCAFIRQISGLNLLFLISFPKKKYDTVGRHIAICSHCVRIFYSYSSYWTLNSYFRLNLFCFTHSAFTTFQCELFHYRKLLYVSLQWCKF